MGAENSPTHATRRLELEQQAHPTRRAVLVVDDDAALSKVFVRALEGAGFVVKVENDPAVAAELVVRERFRAIVTDINMPKLSGIDLLTLVRAYDPQVPVLLVTGDGSLETAIEAVKLGSAQYLLKPVVLSHLVEAVKASVEKHENLIASSTSGEQVALYKHFERALDALWLAFQPIVNARHGRLLGYEALLRSDETTLATPSRILSAAERFDRVFDVGRRVREHSAEAMEKCPKDALLFINLHPRDVADDELLSTKSPLTKFAHRVVLEITEREAIDDLQNLKARLNELRNLGYRVAIDDIGAGYAGLTSFAMVEPDFMKLDMSLIRDVHTSHMRQKVISSMIALARETGIEVVSEGIETREERDCLSRLGTDFMQGYLIAKPTRTFPTYDWP